MEINNMSDGSMNYVDFSNAIIKVIQEIEQGNVEKINFKVECGFVKPEIDKLRYDCDAYKTMFEELKKENEIMREALEFYANNSTGVWTCDGEHELEYNSERAREALEKVSK